jgi:hypothetical protein
MKKTLITILLIFSFYEAESRKTKKINVNEILVSYNYEGLNSSQAIGLEYSKSIIWYNFGLLYENWVVNKSFVSSSELTGYAGVGVFNLLQLQLGYSSYSNVKLRLRAGLPIFSIIGVKSDDKSTLDLNNFMLSLYYQHRYGENASNMYGLSFGYTFDGGF